MLLPQCTHHPLCVHLPQTQDVERTPICEHTHTHTHTHTHAEPFISGSPVSLVFISDLSSWSGLTPTTHPLLFSLSFLLLFPCGGPSSLSLPPSLSPCTSSLSLSLSLSSLSLSLYPSLSLPLSLSLSR